MDTLSLIGLLDSQIEMSVEQIQIQVWISRDWLWTEECTWESGQGSDLQGITQESLHREGARSEHLNCDYVEM